MRRRCLHLVWIASALLLLSACGPAGGGGGTGGCSAEDLAAPLITYPGQMQMVDTLTPTVTWTYSPDTTIYPYPDPACVPDGFHIALSAGPAYEVILFEADVAGSESSWTTPALGPGNVYRVVVEAQMGGVSGPVSNARKFFTGPQCEMTDLVAPVLISPADHAILTEAQDLMFDNPAGCLVDGYRAVFSSDPTFSTPIFDQTYFIPLQRLMIDPATLEPCQTYYWKVAALVGDEAASTQSDFSPVWSFYFNPFGSCSPMGAPTTIAGKVWHDLCALPELGPLPNPLPVGCVASDGSASADGERTIGEPGIPGVVVRMADGPCPAAGTQALLTDEYGNYRFLEVDPGTYCISVDSLDTNNVDILIPGGWTAPPSAVGDQVAYREVIMAADSAPNEIDFGWDYQFLPEWGALSSISGMVWEDLCAYDGIGPVPDPLPEGCTSWDTGYVIGNGMLDTGEVGIPGLTVDLGPGDCPSSGLLTAVTDADGRYSFENLPPGKYCIRINAEDEGNADILLPGRWSLVTSGHMGMTFQSVLLGAEIDAEGRDFAWDRSFPFIFGRIPWFRVRNPAICRFGPGNEYPIVDYLDPDWLLPVIGRNPGGNWFEVLMPDEPLDIPDEGLAEFLGAPNSWQARGGVEPSPFMGPFALDDLGGQLRPGEPPGKELISLSRMYRRCWVYFELGDLLGGIGQFTLPVVPFPELVGPEPTATPEPFSCTVYGASYNACVADSRCTYDRLRKTCVNR